MLGSVYYDSVIEVSEFIKLTKVKNFNRNDSLFKLIVGFKNMKKLYPNNTISKKHIEKNIYWTFSPEEKIDLFDIDIHMFTTKCVENVINNFKIKEIDILSKSNIVVIKNFLLKNKIFTITEKKIIFYYDNTIYYINKDFLNLINIKIDNIKMVLDNSTFIKLKKYTDLKNIFCEEEIYNFCMQMEDTLNNSIDSFLENELDEKKVKKIKSQEDLIEVIDKKLMLEDGRELLI